eukprot:jgi/Phyca11/506182/fgenesh2_kg.PHYCAscaffold_18_\
MIRTNSNVNERSPVWIQHIKKSCYSLGVLRVQGPNEITLDISVNCNNVTDVSKVWVCCEERI